MNALPPRAANITAMRSYIAELRDSVRFYNRLARRIPSKAIYYKAEARMALVTACIWIGHLRKEMASEDESDLETVYRVVAREGMRARWRESVRIGGEHAPHFL